MKIFSSAFKDGEWIPKKYSARGEDISPELQIIEYSNGKVSESSKRIGFHCGQQLFKKFFK